MRCSQPYVIDKLKEFIIVKTFTYINKSLTRIHCSHLTYTLYDFVFKCNVTSPI